MYILLYRDTAALRSVHTRIMIAVASSLFLLATAHSGVSLSRGLKGFVDESDSDAFYQQIWIPSSVLKQAIYVTSRAYEGSTTLLILP
ncbi:hypothetical protein BDV98DRAFT_564037 [Pterulicium gracile]|uniref:Uncharacterized protein n=1 Tax=Pterulicium gracile TaxID=1884261 RepID=A0A5C3QMZ4_9AGAR|nr:hypothetical protein BDV98DRAFT_564037 [Pterula gracilis]